MKNKLIIFYTPTFRKNFNQLPKKIKQIAYQKENIFRENPFSSPPSLKTHKFKLKGVLKKILVFFCRLLPSNCFYFIEKNKILLVDVGAHEVYK